MMALPATTDRTCERAAVIGGMPPISAHERESAACSPHVVADHRPVDGATDAPSGGGPRHTPLSRHRRRVLAAHAAVVLDNLLRIAQPLTIGWAINGLLVRSYHGLTALVALHLAVMLMGSLRQMYHVRVFGALAADATTDMLADERVREDRSQLSRWLSQNREAVERQERVVPLLIHLAVSMLGALLILGWYDLALVPVCLTLLIPAFLLNAAHGRQSLLLGDHLLAEYRREANVLAVGQTRDIRRHLEALSRWRIKLSDAEASSFCLMELFVLGVVATALAHYCLTSSAQAGDIFAVVGYVLLFAAGLRQFPDVARSWAQHDGFRSSALRGRIGSRAMS